MASEWDRNDLHKVGSAFLDMNQNYINARFPSNFSPGRTANPSSAYGGEERSSDVIYPRWTSIVGDNSPRLVCLDLRLEVSLPTCTSVSETPETMGYGQVPGAGILFVSYSIGFNTDVHVRKESFLLEITDVARICSSHTQTGDRTADLYRKLQNVLQRLLTRSVFQKFLHKAVARWVFLAALAGQNRPRRVA